MELLAFFAGASLALAALYSVWLSLTGRDGVRFFSLTAVGIVAGYLLGLLVLDPGFVAEFAGVGVGDLNATLALERIERLRDTLHAQMGFIETMTQTAYWAEVFFVATIIAALFTGGLASILSLAVWLAEQLGKALLVMTGLLDLYASAIRVLDYVHDILRLSVLVAPLLLLWGAALLPAPRLRRLGYGLLVLGIVLGYVAPATVNVLLPETPEVTPRVVESPPLGNLTFVVMANGRVAALVNFYGPYNGTRYAGWYSGAWRLPSDVKFQVPQGNYTLDPNFPLIIWWTKIHPIYEYYRVKSFNVENETVVFVVLRVSAGRAGVYYVVDELSGRGWVPLSPSSTSVACGYDPVRQAYVRCPVDVFSFELEPEGRETVHYCGCSVTPPDVSANGTVVVEAEGACFSALSRSEWEALFEDYENWLARNRDWLVALKRWTRLDFPVDIDYNESYVELHCEGFKVYNPTNQTVRVNITIVNNTPLRGRLIVWPPKEAFFALSVPAWRNMSEIASRGAEYLYFREDWLALLDVARIADNVYRYLVIALIFAGIAAVAPPFLISLPSVYGIWRALTAEFRGRGRLRPRESRLSRVPLLRRARLLYELDVRRRGRVAAGLRLAARGVRRAYWLLREFSYSPVLAGLSVARDLAPPGSRAREVLSRAWDLASFSRSPFLYTRRWAIHKGKLEVAGMGGEPFSLREKVRELLSRTPVVRRVPDEELRRLSLAQYASRELSRHNPGLARLVRERPELADIGAAALVLRDMHALCGMGFREVGRVLEGFDLSRASPGDVARKLGEAVEALTRDLLEMPLPQLYDLAVQLGLSSASLLEELLDRYASPGAPVLPYFFDPDYLAAVLAARDELVGALYASVSETAVPGDVLRRVAAARDFLRRFEEDLEQARIALKQAYTQLEEAEWESLVRGALPVERIHAAEFWVRGVAARLREMAEEASRAGLSPERLEEARQHLLAVAQELRRLIGLGEVGE